MQLIHRVVSILNMCPYFLYYYAVHIVGGQVGLESPHQDTNNSQALNLIYICVYFS